MIWVWINLTAFMVVTWLLVVKRGPLGVVSATCNLIAGLVVTLFAAIHDYGFLAAFTAAVCTLNARDIWWPAVRKRFGAGQETRHRVKVSLNELAAAILDDDTEGTSK